jgi:hypothetical protein
VAATLGGSEGIATLLEAMAKVGRAGEKESGRRRSCSAGAASLPPPNHNRFLERHPHVRNAVKLLARKVELQARKTHEIGR